MRTREEQAKSLQNILCFYCLSDMSETGYELAMRHIEEAEARAEQRVRAEIARDIEKACETIMGIETPMMRGDNLAITLCSYFEDTEGEPDDNGWHPRAIEGHDQVKCGIKQHFLKAIDAEREVE